MPPVLQPASGPCSRTSTGSVCAGRLKRPVNLQVPDPFDFQRPSATVRLLATDALAFAAHSRSARSADRSRRARSRPGIEVSTPPWNPPDAVFEPVWTTLYLLMASPGARPARRSRAKSADEPSSAPASADLAWSLSSSPARSAADSSSSAAWLRFATIAEFSRTRRLAAALLLPYLAWVTFAAFLNAEIWRLND